MITSRDSSNGVKIWHTNRKTDMHKQNMKKKNLPHGIFCPICPHTNKQENRQTKKVITEGPLISGSCRSPSKSSPIPTDIQMGGICDTDLSKYYAVLYQGMNELQYSVQTVLLSMYQNLTYIPEWLVRIVRGNNYSKYTYLYWQSSDFLRCFILWFVKK